MVIDGMEERIERITEVDIHSFEEKYGDYLSQEQVAREYFVNTGTITSWIRAGKLTPEVQYKFGSKTLYLFSPDEVEKYRKQLGIKEHNDATIKEDFFGVPGRRDYSLSYKCRFYWLLSVMWILLEMQKLEEILEDLKNRPELYYKLKDMQVLYQGFFEYLEGNFITQEEVLDVLGRVADKSRKLKDSVLVLDGYTGFTPDTDTASGKTVGNQQSDLCHRNHGERRRPVSSRQPHQLFCLSKQTVARLCKLASEKKISLGRAVGTGKRGAVSREIYKKSAEDFLERNLFRYRRGTYDKNNMLCISGNP